MSTHTFIPINDDTRYDINMVYHKQKNYVVYQMRILDLAFGKQYLLLFRFSEISKFHEELVKKFNEPVYKIPEFPKTHSICFWNKTNNCPRKIQDRMRELQYYLQKLFNDPILRGLMQVKKLLKYSVSDRRRTRSMNFSGSQSAGQKKVIRPQSLPKVKVYNFSKSLKQQILNQN